MAIQEGSPIPADLGPWLDEMADSLSGHQGTEDWLPKAARASRGRANAALRLALLSIARTRNTPRTISPETLDEVILTEQITGVEFSLDLDDAPSVWHTLSDPDSEDWLIRSIVALPGLHGWIGLRSVYDPSGGLLLQSFNHLWSQPEPDPSLPCHGLLTFSGPRDALTDREALLIRHAQHQLYRQLLDEIQPKLQTPQDLASHQYALHYVGPRVVSSGASSHTESIRLASLATQLQVLEGGVPWGSLTRWMLTEPHERPALPVQVANSAAKDEADLSGQRLDSEAIRRDIAQALGLRIERNGELRLGAMPPVMEQQCGWLERSRAVRFDNGTLCLDPEAALVRGALKKRDSRAVFLLMSECFRVLAQAAEAHGYALDLHSAHQYLVAQEL
jgi:hypothetical protein